MTDILVNLRKNGFSVQLNGEKISCKRRALQPLPPKTLQYLKDQTGRQKPDIVAALRLDMEAIKHEIGEQEMQSFIDKGICLSGWIICHLSKGGRVARRIGTLSPIGYGKNDRAAMADLWKKESLQSRNTTT
jgi:hypothetical protein